MDWKTPFRFSRRAAIFTARRSAAHLGFATRPDFIIIGTQRGGTTTLYDYMCHHQLCRSALQKEVDYFTDKFGKSNAFYSAYFPASLAGGDESRRRWRTGEATPYYLFHPAIPERVHRFNPDTRLIVLLRNPVDRAFSHYLHERRMGRETLSLVEALKAEQARTEGLSERLLADPTFTSAAHRCHSYIGRGRYAAQLARWLAHFKPGQLRIIQSEDFYANPQKWTAAALEHIGLATDGFQIPTQYEIDTLGQSKRLPDSDRAFLNELFKDEPQHLLELTGQTFDWDLS